MERRILGRTGKELSIIGIGGVTFVGADQTESDRIVDEALDLGVNYVDVAPSYGTDQETEKRLGGALTGKRDSVFLACKTGRRDAEGAAEELARSLKNLKTDYFDLYQLHSITTVEEVDRVFAPGGAMEVITTARDKGIIKHIGFSAHSVEAALHAMELFDFESALFPINFVTMFNGHFGPQIIKRAQEKGVARLALKAMARTAWSEGEPVTHPNCWYQPLTDPHVAELALRFTLSEPITAAIPPGDARLFRLALKLAQDFRQITEEETAELKAYAQGLKPIFTYAA
jgi:aryl-alcohol dehydrogenase-like predicted oxidoreductase